MKRILLFILTLASCFCMVYSNGFQNERLHYVITYKWGLIHKDAGEATLSLTNHGNKYSMMLAARTKPWADKIYQVRDTLLGTMRSSDMRPLSYSKIAHEDGKYSKDVINYSYSGNHAMGKCIRTKINRDGVKSNSSRTLTASGPVYDMLSVFYYLRLIDYATLTKGKVIKATVFSGKKSETLTIKCLGKEKIKLRNKTVREAYHIRFNFTTNGRKKSSDDIDTWISTDSRHIPLYLVGTLPVGQVRAYYIS